MLRFDFCPTCRQTGGNASQLHRPLQIQELRISLRMIQGNSRQNKSTAHSKEQLCYVLVPIQTDLAGADLSVNVRLLADSVLQVWDVGLEPVPVADDGSSLHGITALRSLPSAWQERWIMSERFLLLARHSEGGNS